ncbi:hypothetical protein D9C73_028010 [Collichthys lucidus]|uniref:Uncharacterized protein n=1 Tax=Collichthys lucidus TaxID=240159 RepID=A0A4U5TVU2_COLLU|nr:hypothetical protein D9C73_028010 [Collichthys lucidus]
MKVFSTAADVERTKPLPESPRLIVLGDVLTATNWMLSIEGHVTVGPHQNIVPGMAALFSCYYVFNLVYQEEASSTLEFIQRNMISSSPQLDGACCFCKQRISLSVFFSDFVISDASLGSTQPLAQRRQSGSVQEVGRCMRRGTTVSAFMSLHFSKE